MVYISITGVPKIKPGYISKYSKICIWNIQDHLWFVIDYDIYTTRYGDKKHTTSCINFIYLKKNIVESFYHTVKHHFYLYISFQQPSDTRVYYVSSTVLSCNPLCRHPSGISKIVSKGWHLPHMKANMW